jgi:group I intron endonuclease
MNALFSSKDELIETIDVMGRDAFVAEIASNPEMYGTTPHPSRKYKEGDRDGIMYMLTNLVDLKIYVGQSKNFDARVRGHLDGYGGASYLTKAINAHGRKNFVSVILLAGIEQEELNLTEIALIKHFDCLAAGKKGYNIHIGGRGGPMSKETRKKIGDGNRGKTVSRETRAKISASGKGKTPTEETRAKISASKMGKTPTEETRAAMSASHLEHYKQNPAKKGLCDKMRAILLAANQRAVVVTLETGEEFGFESCQAAAKEMCTDICNISRLARKKIKKSKCKGGKYKNAYFTARYRDISTPRSRKPSSKETRAKMSASTKKMALVVRLLGTGKEIVFESITAAAKAMGIWASSISSLAINKLKKCKCKGGAYDGQFITARFRD